MRSETFFVHTCFSPCAALRPQKHNIITRVVKCDFNSFIGITWMAQKYENEEVQQRQPENIAKKDPKL